MHRLDGTTVDAVGPSVLVEAAWSICEDIDQ